MAFRLSGVVIGVAAVLLSACSSADDVAVPAVITTESATAVSTSTIEDSSTTSGSTTIPSAATDSAPAATESARVDDTTTSPPCEFAGGLDDVLYEFPMVMSGEVGADIRTGSHPCFERIVIELEGRDADLAPIVPGYWVRYADGPLTLGQTDDQFVELAGDADLLITVNAWMTFIEGEGQLVGYNGPTDIVPANVSAIEELRLLDNSEGVHTWAVGLDRQRDFRVETLADPTRIVVDISN